MKEKTLFKYEICGKDSWSKIYQSIEVWRDLIDFILKKENLPISQIEKLSPGTNAVFKSGKYIVKIFAPQESGFNNADDSDTEIFALEYANKLGVNVPKLYAVGNIKDKYDFAYMITQYIEGESFTEASKNFTDMQKFEFAKKMRTLTDKLNRQVEPGKIRNLDFFAKNKASERWEQYPENFRKERLEYLKTHDFGEYVFVHGDLWEDNIIVDSTGEIYIIDFADAYCAPVCYEHTVIATSFKNDKNYLRGYFGEYNPEELADICFDGIFIHDYGAYILDMWIMDAWGIEGGFGKEELKNINSLKDLRKLLYDKLK